MYFNNYLEQRLNVFATLLDWLVVTHGKLFDAYSSLFVHSVKESYSYEAMFLSSIFMYS